eukprot:6030397-Heterocapsa_arctica.AAC.1
MGVPNGLRFRIAVYGLPELDHWIVVFRGCPVYFEPVSRPPRTRQPNPLNWLRCPIRVMGLQAGLQ